MCSFLNSGGISIYRKVSALRSVLNCGEYLKFMYILPEMWSGLCRVTQYAGFRLN